MIGDAIKSLGESTYTLTRYAPTTTQQGRRQPPSTTSVDILALVQIASGRDLERLPEGLSTNESRIVYTRETLRTATVDSEPDEISIDGELYQVKLVDDWTLIGGYRRAVVTRK